MVGAVMVAEAPVAVCPLINRFVDVGSTVPSVLKSKLLVVPVKSPTSVLAEVMAAAIEVGTVMVNTLPLMPADTPATVNVGFVLISPSKPLTVSPEADIGTDCPSMLRADEPSTAPPAPKL